MSTINITDIVKKAVQPEMEEKFKEREEIFKRHLQYQDIELILLKGHLILEQTINDSLLLFLNEAELLDDLRLTFDKKLLLLIALRGSGPMELVTDDIKKINKIRNKLAHHLNFQDYHEDLKTWICSTLKIKEDECVEGTEKYRQLIIGSFAKILTTLDCLNAVQKKGYLKI